MDDLLSEYLTETNEGLAVLDIELVKLEQNPNDEELLSNIFRLMHTIKGTCGFLGLPRLESVAHAGENILGKIREGDLVVTPNAVSLILECLDAIRSILEVLEQTEAEPEGDDSELISRLNALADSGGGSGEASEDDLEAAFAAAPGPAEESPAEMETAEDEDAGEIEAAPELIEDEAMPETIEELAEASPAAKAQPVEKAGGVEDKKESAIASQSIRVNVDLLENLMTMVSEMVLTRNQLLQILRGQKDSEFAAPLQRLNQVVSELQEGVMMTRMQPIGNAWAKLPRIVRDLSLELGKKMELVMKGAETELDRQVLDLIKDPLTHMVRNSADHGLESTDKRIAAGKPEAGKITLNAYHEGGHIIIQISDDGSGLPTEILKNKAIASGLTTEAEAETMTEQQIQKFIFKAGFSTAAEVTSVSGRGVGMDVVRTNIEKIGGTIELNSVEGRGTTFTIKIPLTLAIVSALIVECGGERFAIPQISVLELVRASANSENTVERINNTPVLRLRNRLLPLVNLRELMKLDPEAEENPAEGEGEAAEIVSLDEKRNKRDDHFIVVSQVGSYTFGIIVDRVFDTEEIVVKPVARILRHIQMFSGNTILGDGSVVMILDPNGIAAATGEVELADEAADAAAEQQAARGEETVSIRGPVSRAAHAARAHGRRLGAGFGRAPGGHRVLRPRSLHGPGGRRDRGYRRGQREDRTDLEPRRLRRQRGDRRTGHRYSGRWLLPDPGFPGLVRRRSHRVFRRGYGYSDPAGRRQPVLPQFADAVAFGRRLRGDQRRKRGRGARALRGRRRLRNDRLRHRDAGDERLRIRRSGEKRHAMEQGSDGRAVRLRHAQGPGPRPRGRLQGLRIEKRPRRLGRHPS
jgi:two-component system chemotaxis sensor kinase CheA